LSWNVKGILFADYVRMIRGHKTVDWAQELAPEDQPFLVGRIDPKAWYPMATFERMGNAILKHVALGDLQAVRMWGRFSVDQLAAAYPMLLVPGEPLETMMRFRVVRSSFFDFEALDVRQLIDDHAVIGIAYHMGAIAEQAASVQTLGFFERLVELAGAKEVTARFTERSWDGDARTLLDVIWSMT
jgi:hypothetical protein